MKINKYKLKREFIPFAIFYLLFDIIVIGTVVIGMSQTANITEFTDRVIEIAKGFVDNITSFKFLTAIFTDFFTFVKLSFYTLIATIILFIVWKVKNSSNSEYEGIENGSSDWAKDGEEFEKLSDGREVLNKKDGFILSKTHRLGTDLKKVLINKNILVVGRIRCR